MGEMLRGRGSGVRGQESQPDPLPHTHYPFLPLALIFNLTLAAIQPLLFLPRLNQSLGFVYRIDSLGLTFGVAWALAMALVAGHEALKPTPDPRPPTPKIPLAMCLMSLGMFHMAHSRDLLQMFIGWEVAGLALWLALPNRNRWRLLAIHAPGWVLLTVALLGLAPPFVPPSGGVPPVWAVPVAVAFGVVAMARSGCWPFGGWLREMGEAGAILTGIYAMCAPYLLAKALVAARWDAAGIWTLALLGTIGLVGTVILAMSNPAARTTGIAPAHAATAIIGLGLASGSPLAAMGAVAILLSGILWVASGESVTTRLYAPILLLGDMVGLWAIAQGALGLKYGIVAVVILPAIGLLALSLSDTASNRQMGRWGILGMAGLIILILSGIAPQAVAELVLRPTVGAMAGGVRALSTLRTDWSLGLQVISSDESVRAALPATGIAVAVTLTIIALHWLSRLTDRTGQSKIE